MLNPTMTLAEAVEEIIDRTTLYDTLEAIADMCGEKAEHLRSNWQDETSARAWDQAGRALLRTLSDKRIRAI